MLKEIIIKPLYVTLLTLSLRNLMKKSVLFTLIIDVVSAKQCFSFVARATGDTEVSKC